jgi:transposase
VRGIKRPKLELTPDERRTLEQVTRSRTVSVAKQERARMMLASADGKGVVGIVRELQVSQPKVIRCLERARALGALAALHDRPGRGRKRRITAEARAWLVSLACQKPKELGYAQELWTRRLLAQHARTQCVAAGHPSLQHLVKATVSRILTANAVRPDRIEYYLEKRDPEFDTKMATVLHVYKQVELVREAGDKPDGKLAAVLSYDEKPGIQAIGLTAPDRLPVPGKHRTVSRDHEYVRHGTVTLMAAIDLLDGQVLGSVVDRHTSAAFIDFLRSVDAHYPAEGVIRVVLDNHSIHVSKETCAYLETRPGRFDFVFTPKHGSWLNLIESFFGKLARTLLRGIRVADKEELKRRIELFFQELNSDPVIFRWRYKLDELAVA